MNASVEKAIQQYVTNAYKKGQSPFILPLGIAKEEE